MLQPPFPVLTALGQPTRWRTFELLLCHRDEGMRQGEIAKVLGVEKNLLSVHLRVMREAGLVTAEKDGRGVIYRVTPDLAQQAAETVLQTIGQASTNDASAMGRPATGPIIRITDPTSTASSGKCQANLKA